MPRAASPTRSRPRRFWSGSLAALVALSLALPGLAPAQGTYVGDADVVTYPPGNYPPPNYPPQNYPPPNYPPPNYPPQNYPPPNYPAPGDEPQGAYAPFAQEELDALLAPIALYPDQLLAQVLMAATFPLDVVEAARFVREHPGLTGSALDNALIGQRWDPSVLSLAAFPQVLDMMNARLDWTRRLGEAFVADQDRVMQTVQDLRQRAEAAGTLAETPQQRVIYDDRTILIEPAVPDVVYVPTYNPLVVYGPWWAPAYEPFYWQPSGIYYPGAIVAGGIGFGAAYYVSSNHWGWARPDWRSRHIAIDLHRPNRFIERRPQYRQQWVRDGWWQHRGGDAGRAYGDRRPGHDGYRPPAGQAGRTQYGNGAPGQRPPRAEGPAMPRASRGNEAGFGNTAPQQWHGNPPRAYDGGAAAQQRGNPRAGDATSNLQQGRRSAPGVERGQGAAGNEAGMGVPARPQPRARPAAPGSEPRVLQQGAGPAPAMPRAAPGPVHAPPRAAPAPVPVPNAAAARGTLPAAAPRPERTERGDRGEGPRQGGGERRAPQQQ